MVKLSSSLFVRGDLPATTFCSGGLLAELKYVLHGTLKSKSTKYSLRSPWSVVSSGSKSKLAQHLSCSFFAPGSGNLPFSASSKRFGMNSLGGIGIAFQMPPSPSSLLARPFSLVVALQLIQAKRRNECELCARACSELRCRHSLYVPCNTSGMFYAVVSNFTEPV